MTIAIGWVRPTRAAAELLLACDSRLRSRGALDQGQKLFRLKRDDCCLAFCGDAQVAYPLFVQVATTLDNYVKTRSRGEDILRIRSLIKLLLENMIGSWDLSEAAKVEELEKTKILFGGWSWVEKRFDVGFFAYTRGTIRFHHQTMSLPYPWAEKNKSLVFIGDYKRQYTEILGSVLRNKYGDKQPPGGHREVIDLHYEPIEALHVLLGEAKDKGNFPAIGGAPQLVKVYSHASSLPFVIRTSAADHYLLGRKLFDWEKTEYPILNLHSQPPSVLYPMSEIPVPAGLVETDGVPAHR